jgi:hypothetical protein
MTVMASVALIIPPLVMSGSAGAASSPPDLVHDCNLNTTSCSYRETSHRDYFESPQKVAESDANCTGSDFVRILQGSATTQVTRTEGWNLEASTTDELFKVFNVSASYSNEWSTSNTTTVLDQRNVIIRPGSIATLNFAPRMIESTGEISVTYPFTVDGRTAWTLPYFQRQAAQVNGRSDGIWSAVTKPLTDYQQAVACGSVTYHWQPTARDTFVIKSFGSIAAQPEYPIRSSDRSEVRAQVIDVPYASRSDVPLQQYPERSDSGPANQQWTIMPASNPGNSGWFKIVNKYSAKCMDATGANAGEDTVVGQYSCDPNSVDQPNQLWQFEEQTPGVYKIKSKVARSDGQPLYLSVENHDDQIGRRLILESRNMDLHQQWRLQKMNQTIQNLP